MNAKDIYTRVQEIRRAIGTYQVLIEDLEHERMELQRQCKHPNKQHVQRDNLGIWCEWYCPDCDKSE